MAVNAQVNGKLDDRHANMLAAGQQRSVWVALSGEHPSSLTSCSQEYSCVVRLYVCETVYVCACWCVRECM